MNNNERIYVRYFDAQTTEDDWEKGEVGSCCSSWDSNGIGFHNGPEGYASVEDALKSVCEANCFKYRKECWNSYGADMGEDFGRFDGSFMVDENNSEATEGEIEEWRQKKRKLWSCYLVVQLEVRAVRELTEDEAESFAKGQYNHAMKKIEYADVRIDTTVTRDMIGRAMKVLADNGIEEDEVETVMQAVGYALLDKELFETKTEEDQ